MNIVGIMSGSSLDGLDIALCKFRHDEQSGRVGYELLDTTGIPLDASLAEQLKEGPSLSVRELKKLEVGFSRFVAKGVNEFLSANNHKTDFIACHGHTIWHSPEDGYTVQIGNGAIISESIGIPCISDLRSNDMALGGQGAPVAPIVEKLLLPDFDFYINLGGIANISFHHGEEIISWDSVPCNQILNHFANAKGLPFDEDGTMARAGCANEGLKEKWMGMPYFKKAYPKSMDNTWVQSDFLSRVGDVLISPEDALATMVEVCVSQIKKDIADYSRSDHSEHLRKCLITGGGAHNGYLVERLSTALKEINVQLEKPDDTIVDYKEAVLIALMGYLRVSAMPNTLSTVTGAERNTIGGAIYVPSPRP